VAWRCAIDNETGPTSLVLTRQGLPHQQRTTEQIANIARGGYVLKDCAGTPDILLIATGSEVELAVSAADALAADGIAARVVSMPSTDVFDAQDADYRESVLPAAVTARVAIEAGVTEGWWRYVGTVGQVVGLDRFGESAPANELFEHFGFSTDNVVAVAKNVLN
jgi:transketolase